MSQEYQVIIVGGGPAGLTAGIYASRARLSTLLIERALPGGQIVNADWVENYPAFPEGISGADLGQRMHQQATRFGLELVMAEVTGVELREGYKLVKTDQGDFRARALIIAGGSEHQKLGVTGEEELTGRGVSYCAVCDGAFFKDQVVAVVGGGNAALTEALFLPRFASKVVVIHRRDQLRAARILQERAFAHPKLEFIWDTVVEEIRGQGRLRELGLRNVKTGERSTLAVAGVFVAVGFMPQTDYLKGLLILDEAGHVVTNEVMETSLPGIFAAGDIRHNAARQVITSAGDGATAALRAEEFLKDQGFI